MSEHEEIFKGFLEHRGLKLTLPRRQILDTVFGLHEHFDAEQLYAKLRQVSRDVSLATVYRTIPLLVEAGLIQLSLRFSSRDVYEHIYGHQKHIHWVCRECGRVVETRLDSVKPMLEKDAENIMFRMEDISIQIRGLCWQCLRTENETQ
jgi:Fur family transcriptional regulator, ferric uptake regulator